MRFIFCGLFAVYWTSHIALAKVDFTSFTNEGVARGLNYLVASYGSGPGFLGSGLCAADLDGDGNTDIVAMGKASGIIAVYRNVGGGMFALQTSNIAPLSVGSSIAAGDFDSDGDLDLVFSQMGGPPRLYKTRRAIRLQRYHYASGIDWRSHRTHYRMVRCEWRWAARHSDGLLYRIFGRVDYIDLADLAQ